MNKETLDAIIVAALGGAIAALFGVWIHACFVSPPPSKLEWFALIAGILLILVAMIFSYLRSVFKLLFAFIRQHWQIVLVFILPILAAVWVYIESGLLALTLIVVNSLVIYFLTKSYFTKNLPVQIKTENSNQYSTRTKDDTELSTLPIGDWDRVEIQEWSYPVKGYQVVPFGQNLSPTIIPSIGIPFSKPILGIEEVPFDLRIKKQSGKLPRLQVRPGSFDGVGKSHQIKPGYKNVYAAYALLTSSRAIRIMDTVDFIGRRIGFLEFYLDNDDEYREELILGVNIRDISYKHPEVVGELKSKANQQVWRTDDNTHTLDMLCINFPNAPVNVKYCQVVTQYDTSEFPSKYSGESPFIFLHGLTYFTE